MTRPPRCPRELDVSRALSAGPDAAPVQHLATCAACRRTWDGLGAAIDLARGLAVDLPSEARREEVRAAVLAAAESGQTGRLRPPVTWARWLALGAAAALAAAWIARGHPRDVRPRGHVAVHARAGADFAMTSPPPDETLRLRNGAVDLDVDPLGPGQRFRVVVGDGEVEVHGTCFAVSAIDDRLAGVSVTRGRVEIRPRGGGVAVLGPGQAWRARAAAAGPDASPPPAPAGVRAPPRRPRPRSFAAAAPGVAPGVVPGVNDGGRRGEPSPEESLYDDAWDAMRAGDFTKAAARFAGVVGSSPHGPLADEGAFWRAVATARAGRPSLAIDLFQDMLDGYSASPRAGEASAMLGWLLVGAGRSEEARLRFRAAAGDPSQRIRASARDGLEATGLTPPP